MQIVFECLQNTLMQFAVGFGVFLVGGLALTLVSMWTSRVFSRFVLPELGLYLFGWLGVPIHELSHAFFCKIFGHRITKVKWFDPSGKGGALGAVTHTYNPYNPYHRIGHYFIGLGPVLLAPLLLALLFYYLVPGARFFPAFSHIGLALSLKSFAVALLAKDNFSHLSFYFFIYFGICISSQMELSRDDLAQVWIGIVPISVLFFVLNLATTVMGAHWHWKIMQVCWYCFRLASCLFCFALSLAVLNLLVCTLVLNLIHKTSGRSPISPFGES
jgi:hypothetical protein